MKLIVGLGNPGEKYEKTRHNLGFMIVDHFLKEVTEVSDSKWSYDEKLKCDLAILSWTGKSSPGKVIVAKPQIFMNNSGMSVALLSSYYKIKPADIWVVHDDLDFPLGRMKLQFGGSGAGHNGIASISTHLGTQDYWRFRMGIGEYSGEQESIRAEEFVLQMFSSSDQEVLQKMVRRGSEAVNVALNSGIERAMNEYNRS